jgi:hypothetical protein
MSQQCEVIKELKDRVMISTPVAFLIFNRPDTADRVFEEISKAKPSKLLVIADGPRPDRPGESEKCAAARAVVEKVDWDCEVLKNYSDVNLGCRRRVSSGLDWVFDNVEEAIIVEDDCLPSQSFFRFCQELLEYYREDTRVMQISGSNFFETDMEESYYFSKYGPIWGWATWRRSWKLYDVNMKLWPMIKQKKLHYDFCFDINEVKAREEALDAVYNGTIDTWDFQFGFARYVNSGISITPARNLITNIGFGEDATHTKKKSDKRAAREKKELVFPLKHPDFLMKNYELDYMYFENLIKQKEHIKTGFFNRVRSFLGKTESNIKEKILKN